MTFLFFPLTIEWLCFHVCKGGEAERGTGERDKEEAKEEEGNFRLFLFVHAKLSVRTYTVQIITVFPCTIIFEMKKMDHVVKVPSLSIISFIENTV